MNELAEGRAIRFLLGLEKSWDRSYVLEGLYKEAHSRFPKALGATLCRMLSEELSKLGAMRKLTPPRLHEFMRPRGTRGHRRIDDDLYRAILSLIIKDPIWRKMLLDRVEVDIMSLQQLRQTISQEEFDSKSIYNVTVQEDLEWLERIVDPKLRADLLRLSVPVRFRVYTYCVQGAPFPSALIRVVNELTMPSEERAEKRRREEETRAESERIEASLRAAMEWTSTYGDDRGRDVGSRSRDPQDIAEDEETLSKAIRAAQRRADEILAESGLKGTAVDSELHNRVEQFYRRLFKDLGPLVRALRVHHKRIVRKLLNSILNQNRDDIQKSKTT